MVVTNGENQDCFCGKTPSPSLKSTEEMYTKNIWDSFFLSIENKEIQESENFLKGGAGWGRNLLMATWKENFHPPKTAPELNKMHNFTSGGAAAEEGSVGMGGFGLR